MSVWNSIFAGDVSIDPGALSGVLDSITNLESALVAIDTASLLWDAAFVRNPVTASGAATDVDLANGHQVELTLEADTVPNFTNPPADGLSYQIPFRVIQDATGSWSILSWKVAGVAVTPDYPGGIAPTLTGTALSVDDLHVQLKNVSGVYHIFVSHAGVDWK